MTTIAPHSKVLVTGGNGFIGMWTIHSLLEKGYSVRAAVRSPEKGQHLLNYFKKHSDKLELTFVSDITADGAFDEAVKGVEGIVHTASPVDLSNPVFTVEKFIEPAVKGTTGILESAAKPGSTVKKIVITASIASVLNANEQHQRKFTEEDWNEESEHIVAEKGVEAGVGTIYAASKTLAERAAWKFCEDNKDRINWKLTVVHPPMVFGPPIQEVDSVGNLNISMLAWYSQVIPEKKEFRILPGAWVDVRDLADAQVLALEKAEAGGERIFVTAGPLNWQEWIDAANSLEPFPRPGGKLTAAVPDPERKWALDYSNEKEQRILGVRYRSIKETTKDCLEHFAARGW